jgi:putative transposase
MAVRWYVAYSLSYRDIEELMLERGTSVDHATLNRWVVKYASQLEEKFRTNQKNKVGTSWRMDETYIKIKGEWYYHYRAVDKNGDTVDFMLSKNRDKAAAKAFFIKSIGSSGMPEKITIDKSGSNSAGILSINFILMFMALLGFPIMRIIERQIKYLNNIVEQDHRGIKRITKPMMGFKAFHSAESTLAGIELWRMLKKGQHTSAANQTIFEQFYALAG